MIRKVNYLEYDDELIRHFAQPDLKDMNLDEVKWALEERGVYFASVGTLLILGRCIMLFQRQLIKPDLWKSLPRRFTN